MRAARDELFAALTEHDALYDPAWQALLVVKTGNEYATALPNGIPVHPVRESADYALGLLDSGEDRRVLRALELLRRLVDAQDTDPDSWTYGLWSWYYDEPLDQMDAPDFNWADFIGVRLVQAVLRHAGVLARHGLDDAVRTALGHAARSVMRRDVELSYTNIAVMGCYVTIMAGELLGDDEITGYGRDRLRRLTAFTEEYGGFPEYNSPVYTGVAICELTRMLRDFPDDGDRELARRLHDRAWQEAATRWHAPSGQWAGPHRRSYATLLTPDRGELGLLQRGLAGRATLTPDAPRPSLDHWSVPYRCPDRLVPYFRDPAPNRDVVAAVSEHAAKVTALSRLRPGYALGLASQGSLWMQGRPVVAYAPGSSGPVAWRPRLTYDRRDLAPARIFTAIDGDTVLAGVCAASDVGAHHPTLDVDWTSRFRAADVRLRFEFLGIERDELPAVPVLGDTWPIAFGSSCTLRLRVLTAGFAGHTPHLEITGIGGGTALDVVLYAGEEQTFDLSPGASPFYAALTFDLTDQPRQGELEAWVTTTDETLELGLGRDATALLRIPATPTPAHNLDALATTYA